MKQSSCSRRVTTAIGLVLLLSFKPHESTGAAPAARRRSPRPDVRDVRPTGDRQSADSGTSTRPSSRGHRTVDGDAVDTRYGPVQVQITSPAARSPASRCSRTPTENRPRHRDQQRRRAAASHDEALSAQSAADRRRSPAPPTPATATPSPCRAPGRAGPRLASLRHVEHAMGTVFSFDVRDPSRRRTRPGARPSPGCTTWTRSSRPTGRTARSAASAGARPRVRAVRPRWPRCSRCARRRRHATERLVQPCIPAAGWTRPAW